MFTTTHSGTNHTDHSNNPSETDLLPENTLSLKKRVRVYPAEPLDGSTMSALEEHSLWANPEHSNEKVLKTVKTYLWLILPINIQLPIKPFEG